MWCLEPLWVSEQRGSCDLVLWVAEVKLEVFRDPSNLWRFAFLCSGFRCHRLSSCTVVQLFFMKQICCLIIMMLTSTTTCSLPNLIQNSGGGLDFCGSIRRDGPPLSQVQKHMASSSFQQGDGIYFIVPLEGV